MVSKVDEFKTVVLAFDVDEIEVIINALRDSGNDTLACDIISEAYGDCGDCDCVEVEQRKSRPAREWLAEFGVDCDEDSPDSNLATLTFDIDTSALELAAVKLAELADAAERAANAAERLEGALK